MAGVLTNLEAADVTPHLQFGRAQLIIVAGRRGFGKTWYIQRYIEKHEPRVFMLDAHGDFPCVPESPDILSAMRDLQRYPTACWRRLVPRLRFLDRTNLAEYAEEVISSVNRYLRRCLVIYNESTLWLDQRASEPLADQIRQGRHLELRHVIDTQRFAEAPDIMRSEASELVIFRTTRSRDRKTLSDETTPEIAEIARTLAVGDCVLVDL